MKLEDQRIERIRSEFEDELAKLMEQIESYRERIAGIRETMEGHENRIAARKEKGLGPGRIEQWRDARKKQLDAMPEKMNPLIRRATKLRIWLDGLLSFHPLRDQLDELPGGFQLKKGKDWKIPNSRFKTFQDIFTPDEAKILPVRTIPCRTARDYDRLPLRGCPVDPARIPDWFMEEFSLGKTDGLSEFEALELKTAAIPELRKIFSKVSPASAYGTVSYRALTLEGYSPKHDGKIITPYYLGSRKFEEGQKGMLVFDSIYAAHRRTLYVDEGYEAEHTKMVAVRDRVTMINRELVGLPKEDPRVEELKGMLLNEIEILRHVANSYKADARDILMEVADITDSLGRHNPGATCARLVKAIGKLQKRLPEIFEKSRYLSEDNKILGAQIDDGVSKMTRSYRAFGELCHGLEMPRTASYVSEKLMRLPELDRLKMRPFNLYAARLTELTQGMRESTKTRDSELLRTQALNAFIICKVFRVQHGREQILRDIAASPMETTIESLLHRARGLWELAASRQAFPEVTSSYAEQYATLEEKIATLVRRLEHYAKQDMSEPEKLAMYGRLKAYLEDIDFADILEKMR